MDDRTLQRLVEKAQFVREAVTVLGEKRDSLTLSEYRSDREQRDIVEREFQTAIEACLDIGEMVLRANDEPVPETNAGVFRRLGDVEILDRSTASKMEQAAGLRNVLAHNYGTDIEDEDVFNTLQNDLPVFSSYLMQIREHVD